MNFIANILFAVTTLLLASTAFAQTCAVPGLNGPVTASGNINTYYAGSGNPSAGAASLTLGAQRAGGGANIAVGDLVLIIQMQGATINSSDTNQYGDGVGSGATGDNATDPARGYTGTPIAGRYEYKTVASVAGGIIGFTSGLINSYAQAAASVTQGQQTYQVIRVPQYSSLTVSNASPIVPLQWNGSTGGVVVADVAGSTTLVGGAATPQIDVTGRGFRGGGSWGSSPLIPGSTGYRGILGTCGNGTGGGTSCYGGAKGEGIAGTPRYVYDAALNTVVNSGLEGYPGGDAGRGAPGNAGGGGNQHNSGGGGGGNGGIGGQGGLTFNGDASRNVGGFGGATFPQTGAPIYTQLVMGGGGGAADVNNATTPTASGGAGGGIVMLRTGNVAGAGLIRANGGAGIDPNSNIDPGGGGGAGGSVLIAAAAGTTNVSVQATGGRGGSTNVATSETEGPGGGGGGGVVASTGALSTTTVTGGASGLSNTVNTGLSSAGGAGGQSQIPATTATGPGANAGYTCLPNLSVVKTTSTPTISVAGATTATYTITATNSSAGFAIGADLVDNTLPPGWTFGSTNSITFSPAQSATVLGGFVEGATPGTPAVAGAPGTAANLTTNGAPAAAPVWSNITIPGNGSVTLTYTVNIPATAPVGLYHNPAGVKYIDPTRSTAGREITANTNNTANRAGAQVGGTTNVTYETGSVAATNVLGSNYNGLEAGPVGENITLQADLRVIKTNSGTFTPSGTGAGGTYTLAVSNVGRAIQALTYATDQATTATVSALLGAPYTVTDTLPAGMTLAGTPTLTGTEAANWTCTGVAGDSSFTCTRNAAAGNIAAGNVTPVAMASISAPVRVSLAACPGPQNNTATLSNAAIGEAVTTNNSSTSSTTLNCAATLAVTKTDSKTDAAQGSTNAYVVTLTNSGPASADGSVLSDVVGAGLTCPAGNTVTCTVLGGGAVCPAGPLTIANLTGAGITIATLPATGSVQLSYACTTN
jgi:uncharacterized repeat protein (TIGR01451 family)